jgi:hypothetical protein
MFRLISNQNYDKYLKNKIFGDFFIGHEGKKYCAPRPGYFLCIGRAFEGQQPGGETGGYRGIIGPGGGSQLQL